MFRDPCWGCGRADRIDAPQETVCSSCGASRICPPVAEWPKPLRRWLIDRIVSGVLAPHGGATDEAWRHMLAVTMRNVDVNIPGVGVRRTAMAANPDDVYAAALRMAMAAHEQRQRREEG